MSITRASYSKQSNHDERTATLAENSKLQSENAQPIRVGRAFGFVVAIIVGLTLCYAGLHYSPISARPTQDLEFVVSPSKTNALEMDSSRFHRFIVHAQSFLLRRTRVQAGQGLTVVYSLPEGAILDVEIKRCDRLIIVEVFRCNVVSTQTLRVENKTDGRRSLQFSEPGFYHFDETVTLQEPDQKYQLVWVRN